MRRSPAEVSQPQLTSAAAVHPHEIFFGALHALAVDDRSRGAGLPASLLAALHVERVVDAIERAVPGPKLEVAVHRRARSQILRKGSPLAAGAEDVHQAVDHLAHVHRTLVAAAF